VLVLVLVLTLVIVLIKVRVTIALHLSVVALVNHEAVDAVIVGQVVGEDERTC